MAHAGLKCEHLGRMLCYAGRVDQRFFRMSDNFTRDDWQHLRSQADLMALRLRAKGLRTVGIQPLPPVDPQQCRDFSHATGITLPLAFADLVTKYAGGWTFDWSLSTDEWGFDVDDAPAESGCGEIFIGVSERNTLLAEYTAFQKRIPESSRSSATPFLFPLNADGGGDYLTLRFDCSPVRVIVLDHEMGYDVSKARVLSQGLTDFLRRWATLGFPAWEQLMHWMRDDSQQVTDSDDRARMWLKWLADPNAGSRYA